MQPWPCVPSIDFSSHQAVARTAGSVLLRLSDSLFLPLDVSDYSETLQSFLQAAQDDLGTLLEKQNISLGKHTPNMESWGALCPQVGLSQVFPTQGPW